MVLVRLLGPVDVVDGSGAVRPIGSALRRTLLALLALHTGKVLSADWLLEHAWQGEPPDSGLRALRFHISRLRKELGEANLIETRPGGYRLVISATEVDVLAIEGVARHAWHESNPSLAADAYSAALAMWRGEPFADAAPCSTLDDESIRLGELRLVITENYFQARLAAGAGREVVADLSRATAQHPLRETSDAAEPNVLIRQSPEQPSNVDGKLALCRLDGEFPRRRGGHPDIVARIRDRHRCVGAELRRIVSPPHSGVRVEQQVHVVSRAEVVGKLIVGLPPVGVTHDNLTSHEACGNTVKAHVSRLLVKLHQANRVQIAILAHEAGLLG